MPRRKFTHADWVREYGLLFEELERISVKEAAQKYGVTPQRIYGLLKKVDCAGLRGYREASGLREIKHA